MPRQLRIEYSGAIYHVMSRANGKGNLYETDVDRLDFIKTPAETCGKTGFQIHAYCLKRKHFHRLVETPNGNPVAGMRWRLSVSPPRFNSRHNRLGWRTEHLQEHAKSDPDKPAIAARLRRETTLTLPWIAARLHAGPWKSLNAKLHRWRKINEAL